MTTKQYLQQMRLYDAHINSMLEEIEHWKAMVLKVTPTLKLDAGSAAGNSDKIGDAIAKIIDLEKELDREIDKYIDRKNEIKADLNTLSNPDQVSVLHKRYVQNKTWERIANEMGMTVRNAFKIHDAGIEEIERVHNENIRNDREKV